MVPNDSGLETETDIDTSEVYFQKCQVLSNKKNMIILLNLTSDTI